MTLFDLRPSVVARWRFGWLTVRWDGGVRGVFASWAAALFALDDRRYVLRIRS